MRIVLLAPLVLLVVGIAAWLSLPWPVLLRWRDPGTTSLMDYRVRGGGEDFNVTQEWVPLKDISPNLVRAVIAAEDGRFREHGGIDWHALADEVRYTGDIPPGDAEDLGKLAESFRWAWENRSEVRGRSTITQQLAKNLYYTPERSVGRKLGEFFVAQRLEWFLDKDRILELYLNVVELGPGLFGAEAAAREYFGTSAADLSLSQAAALAATLPHPLTSNPADRPGRMAWRRDLILGRLRGGGPPDPTPIPEAPPEIAEPAAPEVEEETAEEAGDPEEVGPLDSAAVPHLPDTARPDTARPDTTSGGGTELAPDPDQELNPDGGDGR